MRRLTVIEAFVSSPGDCHDERAALQRAVDEYNRVARPAHQMEVRAFGPEDLYAAHGSYAQQGVNRQLENYDLYIGLWRESAGTPTPNAPSGTVEELREALARHGRTRRPWIMCYFWRTSPTDLRPVQCEIEKHGWYYHGFDDADHLGRLFFTHLSGYLRDEYRLPGHSTTRLSEQSRQGAAPSVLLTFQVFEPDGGDRKMSFERGLVTVGRQPERSDIVLTGERIHRQQGSFAWKDGVVFYMDFAGDSRYEPSGGAEEDTVLNGLQTVRIGDAVVMPDGTRVVLRAVVD